MDAIRDLLYFIYVIHQNAFVSLYYFVITNMAFVLLLFCMLYVFNVKNTIAERETIRPIRRHMGQAPYRPSQQKWGGLDEDIVLMTLSKERSKLIGFYIAILISAFICFFFATKVVLYMLTAMWVVGALSVKLLEGDQKEMADKIENYALGYCLILIVIKIMISLVVGTPMSEWSRSLGVALPAAASGTISGYLPMMFMILTLGYPLAYFRVVAQRYSIAKDNKNVGQRRGEIMRTANQDMLHQHQEDMYRNQYNRW